MAVETGRQSYTAGALIDVDQIQSLEEQSIRVFPNTAARDTALPAGSESGVCWIIASNELQWFDGTRWSTLSQKTPTPTRPVDQLSPRLFDSAPRPSWHRGDDIPAIPAALNADWVHYPTGRTPNPFGFDPIPAQGVFDNATSTGGVLEFGQSSANPRGAVRQLTAVIDADIHIVVISPGSPGRAGIALGYDLTPPATGFRDHDKDGYIRYLMGGGGGGGEITETRLRVNAGDPLTLHGLFAGATTVTVRCCGQLVLAASTGQYSPGDGDHVQLDGNGAIRPPPNSFITPPPEPRFGYTPRSGGAYFVPPYTGSGPDDRYVSRIDEVPRGASGSGASFTANGTAATARTGTTIADMSGLAITGPAGAVLPSTHWALAASGLTLGSGGAGVADHWMYSRHLAAPTATYANPPQQPDASGYGSGGAGGYGPAGTGYGWGAGPEQHWGSNGDVDISIAGDVYPPKPGVGGAVLIRYPKATSDLVHAPVLP